MNLTDVAAGMAELEESPEVDFANLADLYVERCLANEDTKSLLSYLESLFTFKGRKMEQKCQSLTFCATQLVHEKNCTRGGELLAYHLTEISGFYNTALELREMNLKFTESITKLRERITVMYSSMLTRRDIVISSWTMKRPEIAYGVNFTNEMLKDFKTILTGWIQKTPWVVKNNGVKLINQIINDLTIVTDVDGMIEQSLKSLKAVERKYIECKEDIRAEDFIGRTICQLWAYEEFGIPPLGHIPFGEEENAGNVHPYLIFGHYIFLAVSQIQSMAGKIGFLGSILGHEIGHSLIEDYSNPELVSIPFFSKKAANCIQNTYRETCKVFAEDSCAVADEQIDENGSDILGRELAYQAFRKKIGNTYNKIWPPLNQTHEQLFFYGTSIFFCEGNPSHQSLNEIGGGLEVHSAHNIRVNVFAQHAEFKNAFECTDEDPMVKVIKEECHIYGEKAPEIKRL